MHVLAQILPMDARLQFPYQRSFTDNFAAESVAALSQQSTGVDQGIKTFFADQPANGKNDRRRLKLRGLKLGAVNPIIDPMHLSRVLGKALSQLIRNKIADRDDRTGRCEDFGSPYV